MKLWDDINEVPDLSTLNEQELFDLYVRLRDNCNLSSRIGKNGGGEPFRELASKYDTKINEVFDRIQILQKESDVEEKGLMI